jgi:hypothetical protein
MDVNKLFDNLALASQALKYDKIIIYILAGLGPEYKNVILEKVYSMFLT